MNTHILPNTTENMAEQLLVTPAPEQLGAILEDFMINTVEQLLKVVNIAKECVEDVRNEWPEEPPRWTDCGCGGPMTQKLADSLRELNDNGEKDVKSSNS